MRLTCGQISSYREGSRELQSFRPLPHRVIEDRDDNRREIPLRFRPRQQSKSPRLQSRSESLCHLRLDRQSPELTPSGGGYELRSQSCGPPMTGHPAMGTGNLTRRQWVASHGHNAAQTPSTRPCCPCWELPTPLARDSCLARVCGLETHEATFCFSILGPASTSGTFFSEASSRIL